MADERQWLGQHFVFRYVEPPSPTLAHGVLPGHIEQKFERGNDSTGPIIATAINLANFNDTLGEFPTGTPCIWLDFNADARKGDTP